jgi:RHS repeat-associated protein
VSGDQAVAGLNPYTFLGAYGILHDAEVGLYQMGARFYDPVLGLFVSPDPIGSEDHVSPYAYADNNPLVKFDPDGHAWGRIRKVGRAAAKGAKAAGRFAWKHKTDIALTAAMFFPPTAAVAGAVRVARVASLAHKGYKAYSAGRKVNTAVKAGRSAGKFSRAASRVGQGAKSTVSRASQSARRGTSAARTTVRNGQARARQAVSRNRSCRANSFTPDTPVLLADGSVLAIADVGLGDEVWTTSPETGESSAQLVTDLIVGHGVKHLVDIHAAGETITATAAHPFWTGGEGWTDAAALEPGQLLLHPDGTEAVIEWIRHHADPDATVHNFSVAVTHTYYVGTSADTALLAHNCSKPAPSGRKKNALKPDANATGPHTVVKRDPSGRVTDYQTFKPNGRTSTGWESGPRFRATGRTHGGVQPPIFYPRGGGRGARPARPSQTPRGWPGSAFN